MSASCLFIGALSHPALSNAMPRLLAPRAVLATTTTTCNFMNIVATAKRLAIGTLRGSIARIGTRLRSIFVTCTIRLMSITIGVATITPARVVSPLATTTPASAVGVTPAS